MTAPAKYGPKKATHPSHGEECPACHLPFLEGDYTTLVELGPGGDAEERLKAAHDLPYNAIAVEVHYACSFGEVEGA